jgi:Tn3 transposase DDE domain
MRPEVAHDALLATHGGLSLELCAVIYHISPMALYRLICAFGHQSVVTVPSRCGLPLPSYFLADEKHSRCLTEKVYLPTIVCGRVIWHLGYTGEASATAFTQSYGEFQRAASCHEPSYRVRGVLTDGFDSTIKSMRTLFPGVHLGIRLMPRIRNWKDLVFYRPDKETTYHHIDSLFTEVIDWQLIETHWQDLLQVVLSIRAGNISSVTLLRKLGHESRKNRLYQAFRELGWVVRTVFLLQYLADPEMRQQITAMTNKVEAYNGVAGWLFFGGEGIIAENDPEEQEKMIKYNDLVANAVIFQNVVDVSRVLHALIAEGYPVKREDVAALSPYLTRHVKRFGPYFIDVSVPPQPLSERELTLPL